MRAYIAGPLFNEGERWFDEQIEAKLVDLETGDYVEGMEFDRGYISPYFITDTDAMEAIVEDAYILIHDKKISNMKDLLPILEKVAQMGKPLMIIAEDVDGEALATLVVNKLRGTLQVAAVKAPGFGDRRKAMLEDIAILTGGQVVSEDLGIKLENVNVGAVADLTKGCSMGTVSLPRQGTQTRDVCPKQLSGRCARSRVDFSTQKCYNKSSPRKEISHGTY